MIGARLWRRGSGCEAVLWGDAGATRARRMSRAEPVLADLGPMFMGVCSTGRPSTYIARLCCCFARRRGTWWQGCGVEVVWGCSLLGGQ